MKSSNVTHLVEIGKKKYNLKLQKLFDISSSVANSGFRAVEHVQPSLLLDLITWTLSRQ